MMIRISEIDEKLVVIIKESYEFYSILDSERPNFTAYLHSFFKVPKTANPS